MFFKRLLLGVIPLFFLLCMFLTAGPASAKMTIPASYSCGNPHCYGIAYMAVNNYTFKGIQSNDSVRGISGGGGGQFLTNEVWLTDGITSGGPYWVEAGYVQGANGIKNGGPDCNTTNEVFFWADQRTGTGGFHVHCPEVVGSGDYGFNVQDTIFGAPNTWNVRITPHSSAQINAQSTNNAMTPSQVLIGEELAGNCCASGPTSAWTGNKFLNEYDNTWYYWGALNTWTNFGGVKIHNPPGGDWYNGQDPNHSSTGGDWNACTLVSGGSC